MQDFELMNVLEDMTNQVEADLERVTNGEAVALITMQHSRVACTAVSFEPINAMEQTSIKALVSWVSANTNLSENAIAARVAAMCDAEQIESITRGKYDEAIRYLVDFDPSTN